MKIGFGPFEPDSAGVDMRNQNGGVAMAIASGVYPTKTGYGPVPALVPYSSFALPTACVGSFAAQTSSGGWKIFAGTTTKLYLYDTATGWVDYTRTVGGNYNVPSGDFWVFAQFGSKVIAVNQNDDPQTIDIDTGATNFSLLGGSPPKSRYVAVVGDFVFLACQAANPRRLINSAINDTTGWTVGTNLCDQQDFPEGGRINGMAGGEYGWVTQERSIRRAIFQPGSDQAFRFERVERERGSLSGYSLTCVGNTLYFLSDDGFYAFSDTLVPIGHLRVNNWFRDNSTPSKSFSVLGFTDPLGPRVGFAFYNAASSNFATVLFYDWKLDQWSYADQSAQFWVKQVTTAQTLEGLNSYGSIDTGVPFSLDSRVWEGGLPVVAAINTLGQLCFLNGNSPMDARLVTCPLHLSDEQSRSFVKSVYPIGVFNGATMTARVGKRENTQATVTYTGALSPSTRTGVIHGRSSGRVHEFELNLTQSTGTSWKHAEGLQVDAVPDGMQ